MSENIRSETAAPGVRSIVLDRAERRNALTVAMYRGLRDAVAAAEADPEVRVTLLRGAGGTFTSGNDIGDFKEGNFEFPSPGIQFLQALAAARKPVVAAVEGHAIGIGTTMLLHCDFVYVAANARLKLPFVDLGLTPEGASSYLLPKVAGSKEAARLLMLGSELEGAGAVRAGIATETVPAGEAWGAALACARALAAKPPRALQLTKRLLRRAEADRVTDTLLVEIEQFLQRLKSEEAREAFTAFLEKRAPDFSRFN